MNPWAEFQQFQAPPSTGAALATPQAPPPSAQSMQGALPPSSPEEYAQRVQGWTGALQELVQNPGVAAMLVQMGTTLTGGGSGANAVAEGFGAMGRVGDIQNAFGQQDLKNRMAEQQMSLGERRLGLDERELAAREKIWGAQAQNYERLARGGGGGGGASAGQEAVLAAFNECMQLPGATEDRCREAAIRKVYKSGTTAYTPWGGEMTQNWAKQDMSRQQFLEEKEMEARMFGQELPKPMQDELNRLRAARAGAAQPAPSPAASAPGVGAVPQPQGASAGGGFDRPGLAEGVRNGSIKLGDTVPLNDGTRLQITPAVYAKLKSETTGGY